jgi:hypothetical protein
MRAVQTSLKQHLNRITSFRLMSIFRCQHGKMGPAFTRDNETYCTCMSCGARRQFNVERGKMVGAYYYPSPSALYESLSQNSAHEGKDK